MALAWIVSLNVAWSASPTPVAGAVGAPLSTGGATSCRRRATTHADFAALAALPATTVLAISNLGSPILNLTHHRVLAGPYHRNVAGDVLALQAFMGSEAEAAAIVEKNGVGLVVLCRGNDETASLTRWAPAGFLAALAARRRAGMAGKDTGHQKQRRTARNLSHRQAILTDRTGTIS